MDTATQQQTDIKPIEWFTERIGKEIYASSEHYFNGTMVVHDQEHADYLCFIQKHQRYTFSDQKDNA